MKENGLSKYKVQIKNSTQDKNEFVSCLIFNKNGKPLRVKRKANQKIDPELFDFCSGHMKNGEVPEQSVRRELEEELGITQQDIWKLYYLGDIETPHFRLKGTITHCFGIVTTLTQEQINDKIDKLEKQEVEDPQYLESSYELIQQIKKKDGNWRVSYTKELEEKINQFNTIVTTKGKDSKEVIEK